MSMSRRRNWLMNPVFLVLLALFGLTPAFASAEIVLTDSHGAAALLKKQAITAVNAGEFTKADKLLSQAAKLVDDENVTQMAKYVSEFTKLHSTFEAERRKQFEEAMDEVKLLVRNDFESYALDSALIAHTLTDDKKGFRQRDDIVALMKVGKKLGAKAEEEQKWLTAMRIYSDLAAIDSENLHWRKKLKQAARRVRMLAVYAPKQLKVLQKVESKERLAVDKLLKPDEKHEEDEEGDFENEAFKTDWRDSVRDITTTMLYQALEQTRDSYYRDFNYKDVLESGVDGLRALVTTKGLETAFPSLKNEKEVAAFLKLLNSAEELAFEEGVANQELRTRRLVESIKIYNRRTLQLPEEVIVSEFADSAFTKLDQFTSMIWPADLAEFQKATRGEFSGVGVQIQSGDDGSLKVASPLEDTPAFRAGIKAGDIITHINGKNAKGITLRMAVKTITGPPGTKVKLTVRSPDGTVREHTITRAPIKVQSVKGFRHLPGGGWDYWIDNKNKVAYIRLTNFSKDTTEELEKALLQLKNQGARGLILDLRYNPGGLLQTAIQVADRFLTEGTIVETRPDRMTGNIPRKTRASKTNDEFEMPLIVMVNQYSASASEIVSGAFKDLKRARVVGERSYGKGSVQMLYGMRGNKAFLKLTTSHYYLPSGRCLHREDDSKIWGVDPDLKIVMTRDQMEAAIEARSAFDVLRKEGEQVKNEPKDKKVLTPLQADPQLAAGLLLLRLEIADGNSSVAVRPAADE